MKSVGVGITLNFYGKEKYQGTTWSLPMPMLFQMCSGNLCFGTLHPSQKQVPTSAVY